MYRDLISVGEPVCLSKTSSTWNPDSEQLEPTTQFDLNGIKFDDEEPDPEDTVAVSDASSALVRLLKFIDRG
jgi:hypothetical protein